MRSTPKSPRSSSYGAHHMAMSWVTLLFLRSSPPFQVVWQPYVHGLNSPCTLYTSGLAPSHVLWSRAECQVLCTSPPPTRASPKPPTHCILNLILASCLNKNHTRPCGQRMVLSPLTVPGGRGFKSPGGGTNF
jgi:hypothetical protein